MPRSVKKGPFVDGHLMEKIQAANADLIRDPDKIQPGWKLQIP